MNIHSLRHGLLEFQIQFDTHAFVAERQFTLERCLHLRDSSWIKFAPLNSQKYYQPKQTLVD